MVTNGLPALPAGEVYQLWLIGKTKTVFAGLLPRPLPGGATSVLASGVVKGEDAWPYRRGPAPGSDQPTTKPILALPLPESRPG